VSETWDCLRPPPENTPDREVYDTFAQWLREIATRGMPATAADPAWTDWLRGEPDFVAPAPWVGCEVPS